MTLPAPPLEPSRRCFRLTPGQANLAIVAIMGAFGYALYLRYFGIENSAVGLACDAGARSWLCTSRMVAAALFRVSAIGGVALAAAVLHLIRPSVVFVLIGGVAAALGLVLYNVGLSGAAFALLILGFARPAHDTEQTPEAAAAR